MGGACSRDIDECSGRRRSRWRWRESGNDRNGISDRDSRWPDIDFTLQRTRSTGTESFYWVTRHTTSLGYSGWGPVIAYPCSTVWARPTTAWSRRSKKTLPGFGYSRPKPRPKTKPNHL